MQLRNLQINIKNFIQDQAAAEFIVTPIENLNIYKRNYFNNLNSALRNKFLIACQYLKNADKILYEFIIHNHSITPDLGNYGENFIEFLKNNNYLIAAELAQIDLSIFNLNNAFQNNPLTADKLTHITPEYFDRLKFSISRNLYLHKMNVQSFKIWTQSALSKLVSFVQANISNDIENLPVALYLKNTHITCHVISVAYYECLNSIGNNIDLLEATRKSLEIDSKFNLSDFLIFCFENNLIDNYELTE